MVCVADYLDALSWVDSVGGLPGAIERSQANLAVIKEAVARYDWLHFLAQDPATVSNTSICLTLDAEPEQVKAMVRLLSTEGVAHDIGAYRDAPPGIRIWGGATVDHEDLQSLVAWLAYAYESVIKD